MSSPGGNPEWAEVQSVFSAVPALPEDERTAYLAGQPEPIRTEVESLLSAHRGGEVATDGEEPFGIKPGALLGPYRIEEVIGRGGMGVVYRALDSKLNRPVAVKFLFSDMAGAAAQRRFQPEAQMASSFHHPHIVTVYDAGDFEGCQALNNTLYATKVTGRVAFGEPQRLFRIPGVPQYGTTRDFQFDVSADGQRFILPTTGSVPPPPFTVFENWQERFHR